MTTLEERMLQELKPYTPYVGWDEDEEGKHSELTKHYRTIRRAAEDAERLATPVTAPGKPAGKRCMRRQYTEHHSSMPHLRTILNIACRAMDIDTQDLLKPRLTSSAGAALRLYYYFAVLRTSWSLSIIGRECGVEGHTVKTGYSVVEKNLTRYAVPITTINQLLEERTL